MTASSLSDRSQRSASRSRVRLCAGHELLSLILSAVALTSVFATSAYAARPDAPSSDALFAFDPGDVVETFDTARFRVHYTRHGIHSVPLADVDADGVPDHVQAVGAIYEEVLDKYTSMGFREPVGDGGTDAANDDARFDVYLVDTGFNADGAYAAETCDDQDHCSGYMVQENDFAGFPYPSVEYANRLLASHEFFHAIQGAYDAHQGGVFAEGTAVWASRQFDPATDDLELYSSDYLQNTDRALTSDGAGPADPFTYATSVWWQYLSDRFGVDVIRALWEACDENDAHWTELIDGVLADAGAAGFADAFTDFAFKSLLTGPRLDVARGFAEADGYGAVTPKDQALPASPKFVIFSASFITLAVTPGDRAEIRAVAAGDGQDVGDVEVVLATLNGNAVGPASPASGDETIDTNGAGTVLVQFIDPHIGAQSARPVLCIGSSDEVDACIAALAPATAPTSAPTHDAARPAGCTSADAPSSLAIGLLALGFLLARRRGRALREAPVHRPRHGGMTSSPRRALEGADATEHTRGVPRASRIRALLSSVLPALALSFALLGQGFALLHMGLVHHEVCAEHGELVEEMTTAVHADIKLAGLHARTAQAEDDEHCLATSLTRSSGRVAAPALADCAFSVEPNLSGAPAQSTIAAITSLAILDVAPKHGPPAA